MREFTKKLYEERGEDLLKLRGRYNGKDAKRTPEQIRQSAKDQANKYTDKWNKFLEQCETPAQKEICKDVLYRIHLKLDEGLAVADVKEKEQREELKSSLSDRIAGKKKQIDKKHEPKKARDKNKDTSL